MNEPEWERLGKLDDFPEGRGHSVIVRGESLAVFRQGSRVRVLRDRCAHMGAPLSAGCVEGERVRCSWHGWTFDLESGRSDRRSGAAVRVYEVSVRDDGVFVRMPSSVPAETGDATDGWFVWDPDAKTGSGGGP